MRELIYRVNSDLPIECYKKAFYMKNVYNIFDLIGYFTIIFIYLFILQNSGVTQLGQTNNSNFHVYNSVSAPQVGLPTSISSVTISGQRQTVTSISLNIPPRYSAPVDSNLGNVSASLQ